MAHSVLHNYVNPQPDDGDPNVSGPDEWNAQHDIIIDPSLINHGGLANLAVGDPHPQYFLETNAAALTRVDDTNVTMTLSAGASTALLTATSLTLGWSGILAAARGGTGVASLGTLSRTNDTNVTITLGGTPAGSLIKDVSLTVGWAGTLGLARGGTNADLSATGGAGQYLKQVSVGASITVGTIPASDIASGAALTRTNDTNVTVTLGGTPATALLAATSLTLGWAGTLGLARGGTAADLSATGGAGKYLKQASVGAVITVASITAAEITAGAALTKADDTNVTATLGGAATTALLAAASITLGWAGTLAVARGGIGIGTLASNGVLYGNGTGAVQALAVNASATKNFLTQSSSAAPAWATIVAGDLPGSFSGFANPSASVGLATFNGTATTAMRSDGAPALSQSISPSWTGTHTFTLANNNPVVLRSGAAGSYVYYDIGRTGDEGRFGVAGAAGQFFSESAAGDVIVQNLSASTFLLLGEGAAANMVLADATSRLIKPTMIGRNAAPGGTATLQVSSGTSNTTDQFIAIGPGTTGSGGDDGINIGYAGNTGVGISFVNAHATSAGNARLNLATNGSNLVSLFNTDGGVRLSWYISTMSSTFVAPINVTAGDASFKRLLIGTDAAIGGARLGAIATLNSAAGSATGRAVAGEFPSSGMAFYTPTLATNGVQQLSPALEFVGKGWKTNGGSSVTFSAALYAVPLQSTFGDGFLAVDITADNVGIVPARALEIGVNYLNIVSGGLRIGNAAAAGDLLIGNGTNYVASPTTWTTFTPTITSSAGTISSGTVTAARYVIIGKTMFVAIAISGLTLSTAVAQFIYVTIPASKTAATYHYNTCNAKDGATDLGTATIQSVVNDTKIYIRRDWALATNWNIGTNTIDFAGSLVFEIL